MEETKKLHWTQRPENKAKLAKVRRKAAKALRKKAREVFPDESSHSEVSVQEVQIQTASGYAFGKIDQVISDTAGQIGVPYSAVAERVWQLLRNKSRGSLPGPEVQVPRKKLPGDTTT
jgi:hypothetical protein